MTTTGGHGFVKNGEFDGEAKFFSTPFRGTRSFKVTRAGWLTGIFYTQSWVPGVNIAVNYQPSGFRPDTYDNWPAVYPKMTIGNYMWNPGGWGGKTVVDGVGIGDGRWGFYAYNEGSNNFGFDGQASGVIEGFGLVVTGTRGFRCTKARIVALSLAPSLEPLLAAQVIVNYPDVTMYPSFESMLEDYPPDHFEEKTDS